MRVITEIDDGEVSAWSGNGTDALRRFPELLALGPALAGHRRVVLDGEVVAIDPTTGRPDFGRLQRRMQSSTPAAVNRGAQEVGITYVLFDLLELDGTSLLDLTYEQRRSVLTATVEPHDGWLVASSQDDGDALLEAVRAQGLEGVIAKRRDSRYEPGRRSPAWLKVKVRLHQELVVGGWLPGTGTRAPTFGALLLGYHDPPAVGPTPAGPLRFAGRVGTGFRDTLLRELRARLDALATDECPFAPAPPRDVLRAGRWVRPEIVVEVAHAEWTADGVLRHPSYLGERADKDPAEVGREP
jgi:bifunctional non-homologous end joining protein LigD